MLNSVHVQEAGSTDPIGRNLGGESCQSSSIPRSNRWGNALSIAFGDVLSFGAAGAIGALIGSVTSYLLHVRYLALEGPALTEQVMIFLCIAGGLCGWFARAGHYTDRRLFRDDFGDILSALLLGLLINGFIEFASKTDFSRLWLTTTWLLAAIMIPLARIAVRRVLDANGVWVENAIMVGNGTHRDSVKMSLSSDLYLGYNVVLDSDIRSYGSLSQDVIGSRLVSLLQLTDATSIILAPAADEMQYLSKIVDVLNVRMIPYKVVPPIEKLPLFGLSTQRFINSDAVLMTVQTGLASPIAQLLKCLFDIALSLVLFIALIPVTLIISLAVSADGGPVLFGHERVGRHGRIFKCLKFRTMTPNAEAELESLLANSPDDRREWAASQKLRNDPRITRLGRILRSTSIDELPQLINVLRGEMSLVGPRPVLRKELDDHYKDENAYYLLVRPGITGLWQISGRSETSYEQRVRLDCCYVRNWSLWGDIIIMLRTLPAVFYKIGAR